MVVTISKGKKEKTFLSVFAFKKIDNLQEKYFYVSIPSIPPTVTFSPLNAEIVDYSENLRFIHHQFKIYPTIFTVYKKISSIYISFYRSPSVCKVYGFLTGC